MGRVNGRMEIGMIRKMLPHATLIVAVMFVVFFCIDRVNEAMNFLGADISKWLLLIFCILSVATSVLLIVSQRRGQK